jgi:hypothetical protein
LTLMGITPPGPLETVWGEGWLRMGVAGESGAGLARCQARDTHPCETGLYSPDDSVPTALPVVYKRGAALTTTGIVVSCTGLASAVIGYSQ